MWLKWRIRPDYLYYNKKLSINKSMGPFVQDIKTDL